MFSGRNEHLKTLQRLYYDKKADLVLVYGRRRVGKSRLITQFLKDKKNIFHFIGVDPLADTHGAAQRTSVQIQNFLDSLAVQADKPLYKRLSLASWEECLNLLDGELPTADVPCCIFLDELPWMACQRLELIRALFKIWETRWAKRSRLLLIVCGSSVGFLEKHFIRSSLFYGRATQHIHLHPWTLKEAGVFLGKTRRDDEVVELYMHFGGIPHYLEQISTKESVAKAITRLCLSRDSLFLTEAATLFRSSFIRESPKYQKIIRALVTSRSLTCRDLARHSRSVAGSSFKYIIDNLINSDLITSITPFNRLQNTNLVRYGLSDEFLHFYYRFVEPHLDLIRSRTDASSLYDIILPERKLFSWRGYAFEKIMVKHAGDIAKVLGIEKVLLRHCAFYPRNRADRQIDLVFLRTDKTITACEIKYSENAIGMTRELEIQINRQKKWLQDKYPNRRIENVLITNHDVTSSVLKSDSVASVVLVSELLK